MRQKHHAPAPARSEFLELYDRLGPRLLSSLTRRMRDIDAATELWAECWAIAFESWSRCRFDGDGGAEGWVFGIARNQLARYYRTGAVRRRALERLRWTVPAIDAALEEELERLVDRESIRADLADALQGLSDKRRQAIRLRVVDGLDYHEVARRLGCSEPAARAHVSRGLKRLADVLDRHPLTPMEVVTR